MKLQRLLVPVDLIRDSNTAVETALAYAYSAGAELAVVHAYPRPGVGIVAVEPMYIPPNLLARLDTEHVEGISQRLEELKGDLTRRGQGRVEVRAALRRGPVVEEIVEYAGELGADLIVMESRSSFGGRYLLGGVADKVSRAAPCPVLVLPPDAQLTKIRRVLVGVDYSDFSLPVARTAATLAGAGSTLDMVHVWSPPYLSALTFGLGGADPEARVTLERERNAQVDHLQGFLSELEPDLKDDYEVRSYVEIGAPVEELLEHAERTNPDLIALGSHGQGTLGERVRGTVADRILRNASIPVLLVPTGALQGG